MTHPRRFIGALALVAVLGAACGDDNKSSSAAQGGSAETTSSTVAAAPTKAEFVAAGDAVCGRYADQMDEIFGAVFTGGEPTPETAQDSLGKVLDLYTEQMSELRALKPPAGDEAHISALWAEADRMIGETRTEISSADAALELLQSEEEPFASLNEKAEAYGFKACAGERAEETEAFGGVELSTDEQARAAKLTVEGFEYGYTGVPATVAAGPAIVSFKNIGVENHEIGIIKVKPGLTADQAIAQAKANPDDESYVDSFLGAAYALKGDNVDLSVKLEPGIYGYGCFVEAPDGTPHAVKGMISTFTVK